MNKLVSEQLTALLNNPEIEWTYSNYNVVISNLTDLAIIAYWNNKPVIGVSMNYHNAKSLRDMLTQIIEAYESGLNTKVETFDELTKKQVEIENIKTGK